MKKTLDIYITKTCNLNCSYCYVDILDNDTSDFDVKKFLNNEKNYEYDNIKFFWWEPLIKWDSIVEIIEEIKSKNNTFEFTIITNGLLLDKWKINFIKKYNINIIISFHKKSSALLLLKSNLFKEIKDKLSFLFIFEPDNINFPFEIILKLIFLWFHRFIITPEIYSNWGIKDILFLEKELRKFLYLKKKQWNLSFWEIDWDELKKILYVCEKNILDTAGNISMCNRFKSIQLFPDKNYETIYNNVDKFIWFNTNSEKYFYTCLIWCYFDLLLKYWEDEKKIKRWLYQYNLLNKIFLEFSRSMNRLSWKINFLEKKIDEIRFNLASSCNLSCKYCYVVKDENSYLNEETAKNIIDFFLLNEWDEKTISFFWWEPLIEFELLKKLVIYSKELAQKNNKKIKFKIATNFLLANDDIVNFLKKEKFELHISLNGNKKINDYMRDNSTDLLLKILFKYKDKLSENISILLAFSNKEVSFLYRNTLFIKKLWFNKINLEMIFWSKNNWAEDDFLILTKQLKKIKTIKDLFIINELSLDSHDTVIDISVEWKASDNSFIFNKYSINFSNKERFNTIIRNILLNDDE